MTEPTQTQIPVKTAAEYNQRIINATIERCAQAVETFNPTLASNPSWEAIHLVRDIAAAIRALSTEGK